MTKSNINRDNLLKEFENSFAEEISAFYYFNLYFEL